MGSTGQLPREIDPFLSLQRRQAACPQGHGAAAAHPLDQGPSADRRRVDPGHLPVAVANLGVPAVGGGLVLAAAGAAIYTNQQRRSSVA